MKHKFYYPFVIFVVLLFLDIPLGAWEINLDATNNVSNNSIQYSVQGVPVLSFTGAVPSGPVLADRCIQFQKTMQQAWVADWTTADIVFEVKTVGDWDWVLCRLWQQPWYWIGPAEAEWFKLPAFEAARFLALQLAYIKLQYGPRSGPELPSSAEIPSSGVVALGEFSNGAGAVLHPIVCAKLPISYRVRLKNPANGFSVVCTNIGYGPLEAGTVARIGEGTWRYLGLGEERRPVLLELSSYQTEDLPL